MKKIKEQNIVYPIFDTGYIGDGEIVIDSPIAAGPYLKYLGFKEQLDADDLKGVYNILLNRHVSPNKYLVRPEEERIS